MYEYIDDFLPQDKELLQAEKWLVQSVDERSSFSIADFNQEGRFYLYHIFPLKEDERIKELLVGFVVEIDKIRIKYSLNLGHEYMDYIHTIAERETDGGYIPNKAMYKKMFHTSELLFYSNPSNYSKCLSELMTGNKNPDWWGDDVDHPKYKFGDNNDIIGTSKVGTTVIFTEEVLQEVEDMLKFIFYKLLPENNNALSAKLESFLPSIGKNLMKGILRGIVKGIFGWFH